MKQFKWDAQLESLKLVILIPIVSNCSKRINTLLKHCLGSLKQLFEAHEIALKVYFYSEELIRDTGFLFSDLCH